MQSIRSEQTERSSYWQSYMGHLVDIQTALKPFKKIEKIEIKFYNQPGPTVTLFDDLFLRKYKN